MTLIYSLHFQKSVNTITHESKHLKRITKSSVYCVEMCTAVNRVDEALPITFGDKQQLVNNKTL
jgi:hypothetical protein